MMTCSIRRNFYRQKKLILIVEIIEMALRDSGSSFGDDTRRLGTIAGLHSNPVSYLVTRSHRSRKKLLLV